MGDRSCARTSTTVDDNGPAGDDDTDDEQTNETGKDETIGDALKKLGNVKKREMSKFILKDLLGSDGAIAGIGLKSKHLKELKWERMKVNEVYRAVKYLKMKMDVRRTLLKKNIRESRENTYPRQKYPFFDEYDEIMKTIE